MEETSTKKTAAELRAQRSKELRASSRVLDRVQEHLKTLDRLEKDGDRGAFVQVAELDALEKTLQDAQSVPETLHAISALLPELQASATSRSQKVRDRIGHLLSQEVEALGLPLGGRFPEMTVGPFFVVFNPGKASTEIRLGKGGATLAKVPLDPSRVAQELTKLHNELFVSEFDGPAFLEKARMAIVRATRVAGRAPDAPVSIEEFLLELNVVHQKKGFGADPSRASFKAYTRLMASVHLFRARPLAGSDFEIRLVVATREQTRKKNDHLYIPTDLRGRGTHFGALHLRNRNR